MLEGRGNLVGVKERGEDQIIGCLWKTGVGMDGGGCMGVVEGGVVATLLRLNRQVGGIVWEGVNIVSELLKGRGGGVGKKKMDGHWCTIDTRGHKTEIPRSGEIIVEKDSNLHGVS